MMGRRLGRNGIVIQTVFDCASTLGSPIAVSVCGMGGIALTILRPGSLALALQ
jgi:hypothetical protein